MPNEFRKDLSEMLDVRFRKVEMLLLGCATAKSCAERLSGLRKSLVSKLPEEAKELYEQVKGEGTVLNAFLQEGAYKVGFLDGIEAAFLSMDKSKFLEAVDYLHLEQAGYSG